MKSSIIYTLKVCLATLVVSVPVTMAIGFGYIGLIMLVKPQNYVFSFKLPFTHLFIFIAIVASAITINHHLKEKQGHKRFINDRPIAHSIVLFLLYLLVSGAMHFASFDYLLFSYVPMFFTAYVFSRIFSSQKSNSLIA
ncbi:hypothetical protein OQX63_22380 [Pedobacter sp. PF22-3]|uniref:hypothetical protein n=1 Tax=Pedobacter sp. PF22-3 TaxID=2994467 RepID=UPI0022474426|nr:hypothetical protein [Pedobacter sp. PF22-3]MCX2496259.1 hypothetical protein [Pedobacter sp. PF22-3]